MLIRTLTTIIALPILVLCVYLGGLWVAIPLLVLVLLGMHEFYNALTVPVVLRAAGYFFALLFYAALYFFEPGTAMLVLPVFVLIMQFLWVLLYPKSELRDFFAGLTGFFYVALLFSFILITRQHSMWFTWLIFIAACGSDTTAYLVGRSLGKHKLTSSPSPNKSWEGCVGGVIGAAVLALVFGWIFQDALGMNMFVTAGAVTVAAIVSQLGDLFASAVKRAVGIKDYGGLLPGHGGVLDRFDSIITAAPVIYLFVITIN